MPEVLLLLPFCVAFNFVPREHLNVRVTTDHRYYGQMRKTATADIKGSLMSQESNESCLISEPKKLNAEETFRSWPQVRLKQK